jgi:hypothetical protein
MAKDKCNCPPLQLLRGLPDGSTHSHGCPENPKRKKFEEEMEKYDSMDDLEYAAWGFPFVDLGED